MFYQDLPSGRITRRVKGQQEGDIIMATEESTGH